MSDFRAFCVVLILLVVVAMGILWYLDPYVEAQQKGHAWALLMGFALGVLIVFVGAALGVFV